MSIKYNAFGNIEKSLIYLCQPLQAPICVLNGVDETTVSFEKNLQEWSKLSFTVNKYIDIDGEKVVSNGYNALHSLMELYLTNIGRFLISTEPTEDNDGINATKEINAISLEYMFSFKNLINFEINTGNDISVERLINGNVNALNITQKYIQFYDKDDSRFSLLDILLSYMSGWKVGYVDPLLATKKYAFTIDNQDIYSFMMQEMSNTFRCIIKFDTINKTVNAYSEENIGKDTNIFIGFRNLANTINITTSSDNIYTRFNIQGDNNLDVSQVNFGDTYIEDLSYFLNTNYLSESIINKYIYWKDYKENKRPEYISTMKSYVKNLEEQDEIINKVPIDSLNYDWDSFSLDNLNKELEYFNSLVECIENEFKNETTGQIDMEALKASIYWWDYKSYTTWIIPNIQTAIKNYDLIDDDKVDYDDSWKTEWDLYGTDELSYQIELYDEQLKALDKYKKDWDALSKKEQSLYVSKENYETFHNQYIEIESNKKGAKNKYDSLIEIVNNYNITLDNLKKKLSDLVNEVSIKNEKFNFNDVELKIINNLYLDTDYINDNFVISSLYTNEDIIDEEKLLLENSLDELSKESQPQYSFSCELDNLLAIDEFKCWHNDLLELGNFIRLGTTDTHQEKLRLISITFNPCLYDNNLSVKFSNMLNYRGKRNDFTELFDNAITSSKNSISNTNTSSSKDSTEVSTEIIKYILNSRYTNDKLGTNNVETLSITNANLKTALIDYAKISELDAEIGKFVELHADELFAAYAKIDYLVANYAKITDLNVTNANITNLNALTANINTILAGSIGTGTLQTIHLTSENTTLDNTFINNLLANYITAKAIFGDSISTNEFKILSDSGHLSIFENVIQFRDKNNIVRIQIGEDTDGNFTFFVLDDTGKGTLIDSTGVKEKAIADGLIKSEKLASKSSTYDGISADKLNIDSVVTGINNGTTSINSTKVYFDSDNKSLNTIMQEMTTKVTRVDGKLLYDVVITSSNGTTITDTTVLTANIYDYGTTTIATGNFTYQWYLNGTVIKNATEKTYTVDASSLSNGGQFTCKVSYEE